MITYEKYAKIRDKKNLTDGKVAEIAGIGRSTFSDWKSGRSIPKLEKMQKIADALEMDYTTFVGPVGRYSALNPNNPLLIETTTPSVEIPENVIAFAQRTLKLSKEAQLEVQNFIAFLETKENRQ